MKYKSAQGLTFTPDLQPARMVEKDPLILDNTDELARWGGAVVLEAAVKC